MSEQSFADFESLRAALEQANSARRDAAHEAEYERTHTGDLNYVYGSERTFGDLAEALLQVREDINMEMEIAHDPVLRVLPGELDASGMMTPEANRASDERIEARIDELSMQDDRLRLLIERWGFQTMQEALARLRRYELRRSEVLHEQGVQSFTNQSVQLALRQDFGLEEPLPGMEDDGA